MQRRLAAIMVADVDGYSALMERDEEGTATRLAACRAICEAEIARADGRVFKTMGDAVLAEFASPVNALRAAVGIRDGLALVEQGRDQRLSMRIGLHLADVMVEGDDLIGDGVNVAARIQQSAAPGAIDISAPLLDQVRRVSPYAFDDLGEQRFRNLDAPVRVWRLRGEIERHVFQISPTREAPKVPRRPHSLAVLPIEVPAGGDDRKFLADGITEDLILEFGHFRRLFVASRTATRVLEGTAADPMTVGERLGVRYVLGGTLRQLGQTVRLALTLTETEAGGVVWSDRLSLPFDELVEGLEAVVARIAATVLGRIEESDIATARRARPESMSAYEFHLRGLEYHRLGGVTDENLRNALAWFERAIEADPSFARPQAMWVCARASLPDFDWEDAQARTQRALELDPNDPEANRIMGSILMHGGEFEASRRYHERAIAISPSDAYLKARCASFYTFVGEPLRALALLDEAEELDPFLPVWCAEERGIALYALDRHEEALDSARRLPFQTRRSRLYRAASRMALGDQHRARHIVAEALASAPGLTVAFVRQNEFYRDPAVLDLLIDRLLRAGLPAQEAMARAS